MADTGAELLNRMIGFGRYLRSLGLPVAPERTEYFVRAVQEVGLNRDDFRLAARIAYVTCPEDRHIFDAAFDWYWSAGISQGHVQPEASPKDRHQSRADTSPTPANHVPKYLPLRATEPEGSPEFANANAGSDSDGHQAYSAIELLRQKDFGQFSDAEVANARKLIQRQTWSLGDRLARRTVASCRGPYVDLRRSRRSTFHHDKPQDLARRTRKLQPRPIVAICDISGSMDRYSRMLLQFLHAVERGRNPLEVFLFGTRLTRITRQLRSRDVNEALAAAALEVSDWSGGTRIGECLYTFNTVWSRRVLRRSAVVLLISDGWDRGDPHLLGLEMARLQRNSHRLIWLNPLLGSPGYQPMTRGILSALPYVDDFLSVHNLASLDTLADSLAGIKDQPPTRRQGARTGAASSARAGHADV